MNQLACIVCVYYSIKCVILCNRDVAIHLKIDEMISKIKTKPKHTHTHIHQLRWQDKMNNNNNKKEKNSTTSWDIGKKPHIMHEMAKMRISTSHFTQDKNVLCLCLHEICNSKLGLHQFTKPALVSFLNPIWIGILWIMCLHKIHYTLIFFFIQITFFSISRFGAKPKLKIDDSISCGFSIFDGLL